jgi:hypothetical protein
MIGGMEGSMTGLPILDMSLVTVIKKHMDEIKNDGDPHKHMDSITDLVQDNKLYKKEEYKPLLRSVCDLLREKGFPSTADFLTRQWFL